MFFYETARVRLFFLVILWLRLTHYRPKLPAYRNQSIDLLCKSTGFYLMVTAAFSELMMDHGDLLVKMCTISESMEVHEFV